MIIPFCLSVVDVGIVHILPGHVVDEYSRSVRTELSQVRYELYKEEKQGLFQSADTPTLQGIAMHMLPERETN